MEVTTKKYYHCAICGKTSVREQAIMDCEAAHIYIDAAAEIEAAYGKGRNKYPDDLRVHMSDGKIATYAFVRAQEVYP